MTSTNKLMSAVQRYYASGMIFTDCSLHGQSIGDKCGCCGRNPDKERENDKPR